MIWNFTQHGTTLEQQRDGICDVENVAYLQELLTFDEKPSAEQIQQRAKQIADYAMFLHADKVMIGGAPFLMPMLQQEMRKRNIHVYYAFSKRESIDVIKDDGTVEKKSIFKYEGLIASFD